MTSKERQLYHQIHPIKLLADWGSTPFSLYLFWHHLLIGALITALAPSIVSSAALILYAPLDRYRDSAFGQYIAKYMSRGMQAIRLIGFVVMSAGAWLNLWWVVAVGLVIVLFGWLRGILFPAGP
jgi:hypothetical protein